MLCYRFLLKCLVLNWVLMICLLVWFWLGVCVWKCRGWLVVLLIFCCWWLVCVWSSLWSGVCVRLVMICWNCLNIRMCFLNV